MNQIPGLSVACLLGMLGTILTMYGVLTMLQIACHIANALICCKCPKGLQMTDNSTSEL